MVATIVKTRGYIAVWLLLAFAANGLGGRAAGNDSLVKMNCSMELKAALSAVVSWLVERSYDDLREGSVQEPTSGRINIFPLGPTRFVPPLPSDGEKDTDKSYRERRKSEREFIERCCQINRNILDALRKGRGRIQIFSAGWLGEGDTDSVHGIEVMFLRPPSEGEGEKRVSRKNPKCSNTEAQDMVISDLKAQATAPSVDIAVEKVQSLGDHSFLFELSVDRRIRHLPFTLRLRAELVADRWRICPLVISAAYWP